MWPGGRSGRRAAAGEAGAADVPEWVRATGAWRARVGWCIAAALLGLGPSLVGCGGPSADELLDTAHLEELQHNPTHARALYEDVIRRHPGTPQAERAAARLRALAEEP